MSDPSDESPIDPAVHRCAGPVPAHAWRTLRCGPVEMQFDPERGWLRRIVVDGREVVRAVYGAVRDRDWRTVTPEIRFRSLTESPQGFHLTFESYCQEGPVAFRWQGDIAGETEGRLVYNFTGEALTGFWSNRIGLCVLHPIDECAGRICQVENGDGKFSRSAFPRFISPHQVFQDLKGLTYQTGNGRTVRLRLEGEIFETEDQRNWSDASYKTYGTPLSRRFPVWIPKGTRVVQSVTLEVTCSGALPASPAPSRGVPELRALATAARPLPAIGLGLPGDGVPHNDSEITLLKKLCPAHVRVDLRLYQSHWPRHWRAAVLDAQRIGTALEAAVFISENAAEELTALAGELESHPGVIARWLIFHRDEPATGRRWVKLAQKILPAGVLMAAGSDANFAEFNRSRPVADETALPCFPLNPQVHAFDEASLMENLGVQASLVESARIFAPRKVVVSPITLLPRFNAVATSQDTEAGPPPADPRQRSLFAAAWTVGSLARLAALEHTASLTYFETAGKRGLIERGEDEGQPSDFRFPAGSVFPVYHVFGLLAQAVRIRPSCSSHPLLVDGFCIRTADGNWSWAVANLTPLPLILRLECGGSISHVSMLDETTAEALGRCPEDFGRRTFPVKVEGGFASLELMPFAVARVVFRNHVIDGGGSGSGRHFASV